ncbi:hypothetical protein [Shinella sp. JR1-6]|uniref:hypothetical protein n=1 Tax=Shinella sp. JR1-6 TaxID=2527671 RepID=UPI00102D5481|nr:hypothetical protein [Shinella sp. JR1-6]TAA54570.1 hypothetical protein EXZ48_26450 [Shinella sp. JR1-6]
MKTPRRPKPNGAIPILTAEDGSQFKLTSDQVWFVRQCLRLSQRNLGRRLATSQPSILRLENKDPADPGALHDGPAVILLCGIAKQEGIELPAVPVFDRESEAIKRLITKHTEAAAA